ncbi:flagellar filament capping protein FliD [Thiomicrospira sp. WB1]|uniref:flagellar filament capping protein FliD n=1 Tax=Thiomicrospira sp. WB1 TaxID=1685380 RepID=UPI000749232D|nr:flagellar filament capping protein FliD [Thiomicrospira sp. WB1]KUJ71634.1 hypothetical protein AVO41_08970 [Thiomicrospira sp. WB1]
MANEIGTTLLNGLTNSSFNLGEMSKTLAEAEVAGKRSFIEQKQEKTNTELDAIKYLKTNLTAFQSYVTDLASPDLFTQKSATSSNESIVTVTASEGASPASYNIESKQLAQVHTEVSDQLYASSASTITDGTLTIDVAGQSHSITVSSAEGNNTLEGLRNYINSGDYGVNASIVNNGGNYQMMFTSKTQGAAGQVTLGGTTDVASSTTTTSMGQDAQMVLNGLTLSSSTNTFDEAIEGVTFQLQTASPGTQNTVSVSQDTSNIKDTINQFVDVYNQLHTITDELGSYDKSDLTQEELESEEYQYYGDLAGSSLLRSVESQLRSSLSGAIDELETNFSSLSMIGVSFDREGKLEVDAAELDNAINNNLDKVASLFAKGGSSDDNLVNVLSGSDKTVTGNYDLNITQTATRAAIDGGAANLVDDGTGTMVVDLGADATFDISVDGSTASTVTIGAGQYTLDELASTMTTAINNLDAVKNSGASVSVTNDGSKLSIASEKFGGNSAIDLSAVTNFADSGLTAASATGQNVDGTLTDKDGVSINIGAYVDPEDGRKIEISDFASKDGEFVSMRGLSFEVLGGATGDRGTITFAQGFASRLNETVNTLFDTDNGLISKRMESLNNKLDDYQEQSTELDDRYQMLLQKYQMQFSSLQSILSSTEQTRSFLTQRFGGDSN